MPLSPRLPQALRHCALPALLGAAAAGAGAQSLTIAQDAPPAHILPAADVQRLSTLMGASRLYFLAQPSPDGRTLLVNAGPYQGFVDVDSGAAVLLDAEAASVLGARQGRGVWTDADHLAFAAVRQAADGSAQWHIASFDRRTGRVSVSGTPLPVGEVLALAPGGRWALALTDAAAGAAPRTAPRTVPRVRTRLDFSVPLPGPGPARAERMLEATTAQARLELLDLQAGTSRLVATLPIGSVRPEASFDSAGRRFALVTNWFERTPRTEETLAGIVVQEALGQYPLADNPYHRNSKLAIYDTAAAQLQPREVRAASFPDLALRFQSSLHWNPSGTRLVAGVDIAARLAGRANATFYKPGAQYFLAFDAQEGAGAALLPSTVLQDPLLTAPGDESLGMAWLSDQELVFAPLAGMDRQLHKYDFASARLTRLAGNPPGTAVTLVALPGRRELLYVNSSASQPPELWRQGADGGAARVQTQVNQEARSAVSVSEHPVSFRLANGEQRQGYWFAPADAPWPPTGQRVVLWQAGGPGGVMDNDWGTAVEMPHSLLPSFGIGVLVMPLQQRPGLNSRLWNQLADGDNFGAVDIDELAQIAGQVVERGWARADQVGISGCSYGGYMTSQSIVRHPQRYAAANPQCSLLDLVSEFQTGYASHIAYLEGGSPWARWNEYLADSPGFHGASVRTPTLVFHGTLDFLPVGIAENFYEGIRASGTDARILRFAGERHGLRGTANQLYAAQEQISWFRRYLKP